MKKLLGICLVLGLAIGIASVVSAATQIINTATGTASLDVEGTPVDATESTNVVNVNKLTTPTITVSHYAKNLTKGGGENPSNVNAVVADSIEFRVLSPDMVKKMSVVKIITPELYDADGYPVEGGLMNLRMGVIEPGLRCRTCGARVKDCPGHFGYIEMARPVVHIKYLDFIYNSLRSTCPKCGKICIDEKTLSSKLSEPFDWKVKLWILPLNLFSLFNPPPCVAIQRVLPSHRISLI